MLQRRNFQKTKKVLLLLKNSHRNEKLNFQNDQIIKIKISLRKQNQKDKGMKNKKEKIRKLEAKSKRSNIIMKEFQKEKTEKTENFPNLKDTFSH